MGSSAAQGTYAPTVPSLAIQPLESVLHVVEWLAMSAALGLSALPTTPPRSSCFVMMRLTNARTVEAMAKSAAPATNVAIVLLATPSPTHARHVEQMGKYAAPEIDATKVEQMPL